MPQPIPPDIRHERVHSLDFLRGVMMFLGILLHGMVSFMQTPIPVWPARDDEHSLFADTFVYVVHDFRMQTFFFLAGCFGCLLFQRYGLAGMVRHRLGRLALPFGLALIIIQPALQAIWLLGDPHAAYLVGLDPNVDESPGQRLANHFLTGSFFLCIEPYHLWFLWFLLIYFAAMIPLVGLGHLSANGRVDRLTGLLFSMPGKSLILAALTTPLLLPMKVWGMADTPSGWRPHASIVGYYFFFFLAGWLFWRHRERMADFTRRWVWSLPIGNLVVLPALLLLVLGVVDGLQGRAELPGFGYRAATNFAAALYTWLMIGGLMGVFQHFFDRERHWVRYLADASYWCYLWHLAPIVALQILLAHAPLPGLVKFAIIIGVSLTILLVTYEWCVRYTWIGAMLNGRKYREKP